jgi:hypothetical protein
MNMEKVYKVATDGSARGGDLYGKHFGKTMVLFLPSSVMNILWNDNVVSASILSTMNTDLKRECGLILGIIPEFGWRN